jgi:hypothetical protein
MPNEEWVMPYNLESRPKTIDFIPYAKYNAKSGRWYSKTEAGDEFEISNMTAVFDLENIRSGWFHYAEGQAPDIVWDIGTEILAPPSTNHKRGFAVMIYNPKELGGGTGVREFSSTSSTVIDVMTHLYNAFLVAPEAKEGKVPVVTCSKVEPLKSKYGINYQPILTIQRWVDRPAALPGAVPDTSNDSPPFPAANGSGQAKARSMVEEVPPPVVPIRAVPAAEEKEPF